MSADAVSGGAGDPAPDDPGGPAADRDVFRQRWSRTHGGLQPAPGSTVDRYLTVAESLARPLARVASPDAVTAAGVAVAAAAAVLARRRPEAAGAAVLVNGVLDGLDGAVAVVTGTTGPRGFLLDSLADRVSDGLLLLALRRAGAAEPLVAGAAAATVGLEYARARAASAGFADIGVVTAGERPARLLVAASGLLTARLLPRTFAPQTAAAVLTGLVGVGAGTFVRVALRGLPARG